MSGKNSQKTLIAIFIVVIGYVITGLSTYYSTKYSVQNEINLLKLDFKYFKEKVYKLEKINPDALEIRMSTMEKELDNMNRYNSDILKLLSE